MSLRRTIKDESRSNEAAQDQESDYIFFKKIISKNEPRSVGTEQKGEKDPTPARKKMDQKKTQGAREILPSRNGAHPLEKRKRVQQPAVRISTTTQGRRIVKPMPDNVSKPILEQKQVKSKPKNLNGMRKNQPITPGKGNSRVSNMPKMPKGKPVTADSIQKRLKKKSPWFQSLMSPVDNAGVKIPDPIGTETATYQHLENVAVKVGTNGVCGLRVVCPYINSVPIISATDGFNYQITLNSSTPSAISWGDGAIPSSGLSFRQVPQLMKSNARNHRIVSACVLAQSEVSTLNDSGELCAFVTPFGCNLNLSPYSLYQFQYDSSIVPANEHLPIVARWYPLQAEANPTNADQSLPVYENVSYQDFINPNDDQFAGEPGVIPWEFGVVCTGLAAGAGVVRFQICVNYEFIPLATSAMVVSSPSPTDQVEEDLVNTWVSEAHVTEVVSQREASVAQSASRVSEDSEPSGIGMLFNVIEEVLPLAAKAIPLFL